MTAPHFTSAAIAAAFALALAGSALAGGPTQPGNAAVPSMSAPQIETQMPSQLNNNAEQSVEDRQSLEDKKRAAEAAAKAKANAAKSDDGTTAK